MTEKLDAVPCERCRDNPPEEWLRAYRKWIQEQTRAECARLILTTPMRPGFVLDLCREWLPDPPES